jgi:TrmH family RNA methyltransferase
MIDSPSNPIVRSLRALASVKGRRESGQFLVEGVRSIEDGLQSGALPELVLYNSKLLERTARGNNLFAALNRAVPGQVFEGSERALAAAAQTEHPQGIIAAFSVPDWPSPLPVCEQPLILICDGVSDPGNMGTLLRSAEAARSDAVLAAQGCVDVFNPKVVRSAVGAHFRLPIYQDLSWEAIGAKLKGSGVAQERIFCTEAGAETAYYEIDWTSASALIVSNEAHGLSAEAQNLCASSGRALTIPMGGGTESLNVAVAGSIVLFEAARQRRVNGGS